MKKEHNISYNQIKQVFNTKLETDSSRKKIQRNLRRVENLSNKFNSKKTSINSDINLSRLE